MAGVYSPRWELDPTALVPGEGLGAFLQDTDIIPLVLAAKVILQAITRVGIPQVAGEGAGASLI